MAKKLAVAEILSASVSNLNTPAMQIVEIPLDKLLDNGGNFFRVEDVQALAAPVMRHRLLLSFAAEAEQKSADDVVAALLQAVPFPG